MKSDSPPGWRGAVRDASSAGGGTTRTWSVAGLIRACSDALEARFNPVCVMGEISGFSRAASGHCYFTLKDTRTDGQLRCAMFKRSAAGLDFSPRDGDLVEVSARLGIYEARGDLQLVVESMQRAGQGSVFEQFLQLKSKLEAEGLFAPERKRPPPAHPRGIGVVTSSHAAALHDVLTALSRRVPHIPVTLVPASVQGAQAAVELITALNTLYALSEPPIDVILLVRGGGSLDDLWAFNHEQLARTIARSPVPVITGIGHETDFTIADFVADLRAPTPTAAAELCATPRDQLLASLNEQQRRLETALQARWHQHAQRLDACAESLSRPAVPLIRARAGLGRLAQSLSYLAHAQIRQSEHELERKAVQCEQLFSQVFQGQQQHLERLAVRLQAVDPSRVLGRGYTWLQTRQGKAVTTTRQLVAGESVRATLSDGEVDLTVQAVRPQ